MSMTLFDLTMSLIVSDSPKYPFWLSGGREIFDRSLNYIYSIENHNLDYAKCYEKNIALFALNTINF